LMEAVGAGLLLLVVDASDAHFREQLAVADEVLADLGADATKQVLVFNKSDCAEPSTLEALKSEFPDALFVSAHSQRSVEAVRQRIVAFFEAENVEATVLVPFADGKRLASLHAKTRVLSEVTTEVGVEVRISAPSEALLRLGIEREEVDLATCRNAEPRDKPSAQKEVPHV